VLSIVVVAVVATSLWFPWRGVVVAIVTVAAVYSAVAVNPLTRATGVLDESSAAKTVRQVDAIVVAPRHGTWAASDFFADGLLNGEGVDSLSSFNDPVNRQAWEVLDPHHRFERAWNRLGYIGFDWEPGRVVPRITAPLGDVVAVAIDPCDARLTRLRLAAIVSAKVLSAPCLRARGALHVLGQPYVVYQRVAGTPDALVNSSRAAASRS
jgi:hypothetical protein